MIDELKLYDCTVADSKEQLIQRLISAMSTTLLPVRKEHLTHFKQQRSVPTSVYQTLVVALVLSRLDYGNAVLVQGLPAYLYNLLQSVLNAAARSITGLRRSDHNTVTLASFHWLKAPEHVQYKLATIVYRSLNGMAPHYLAVDLRRLSDMPSRPRLRSSLTHQLDVR